MARFKPENNSFRVKEAMRLLFHLLANFRGHVDDNDVFAAPANSSCVPLATPMRARSGDGQPMASFTSSSESARGQMAQACTHPRMYSGIPKAPDVPYRSLPPTLNHERSGSAVPPFMVNGPWRTIPVPPSTAV